MRNKWFVGGILVPAALLAWGTVACITHDAALLGAIPAALSIALCVAAYKAGQANSFGPVKPMRWDSGTSQAVERWNKDRDERDAAKSDNTP